MDRVRIVRGIGSDGVEGVRVVSKERRVVRVGPGVGL